MSADKCRRDLEKTDAAATNLGTAMDPVSEVIREHAPFVWRVLRHHGIPEDQLEDLSQDVFIVICRRLGDFEQRSSLRTWIYGICRNVVFDARRRQRRKQETPSD